ncbi:hypothetical protein M9H77_17400 [Catharanthus roseus]|uniref:Uncharacterized protein n=1 Tax=Catharanthus roseus TaxID=4058 RepID=A0ACC0B4H1_CATRO|nr:hypothetical protein M9H77_17400 [Catharanthus roseus]
MDTKCKTNKHMYQSEQLPKDTIEAARCGILNAMSNRMVGKTTCFEEARVLFTKYTSHLSSLWEIEDRSCKFGAVIPLSDIVEIGDVIPLFGAVIPLSANAETGL